MTDHEVEISASSGQCDAGASFVEIRMQASCLAGKHTDMAVQLAMTCACDILPQSKFEQIALPIPSRQPSHAQSARQHNLSTGPPAGPFRSAPLSMRF